MMYTIVVQNSERTESNEYSINIVELRKKENTYDSLNIDSSGKVTITRRIGYYQGETYVLDTPIMENYDDIFINLFKGINYIFLQDDNNTILSVSYILKNDFTDVYSTRVELSTKIQQSASNILLQAAQTYFTKEDAEGKANKETLISEINIAPGDIKIKSKKLALEGYTTINGGFAVDENGNATIANGAVTINNEGIQMQSGTKIVGGDGMLTQFQFEGNGYLGHLAGASVYERIAVYIPIFIPEHFIITDAVLYGIHTNTIYYVSGNVNYGSAKNIKLYKTNNRNAPATSGGYIENVAPSSAQTLVSNLGYANGRSFSTSTPENFTVANLKNYITTGNQYLYFADYVNNPGADWQACSQRTGMMDATVYVSGYLQS